MILAALAVVYLSHLGYLPLDIESDEARRALVSGEMVMSHNYISPTINGLAYLNKPPLYGNIVAGYFNLTGDYSMFTFRLQVIVAVFVTGLLIYFFTKKYIGHYIAFFSAIAYMTNGRFLIYESLYGMIDPTFALAVYANFMVIYYFGSKKDYKHLFIYSYILCTIAFFLKGLPAIAFQGISLLTWFIMDKNFKKLFSLDHIIGGFVFAIIVCSYYLVYFSTTDVSLANVFTTLFNESEKRTLFAYGISDTIKHFVEFPGQLLYHFLPWTIFLIALIQKKTWQYLKENKFIYYATWIFIANIPLYWLSVDVMPKYLFMFVPLMYTVAFYIFFEHAKAWHISFIRVICITAVTILFVASIVLPFTNIIETNTERYVETGVLILGFGAACFLIFKKKYTLYAFVIALVIARAAFNFYVVEERGERFFDAENTAAQIADTTKGHPLYILNGANVGNFDGYSFHISTKRNNILTYADADISNAYYIVDAKQLKDKEYIIDISFENLPYHEKLFLVHQFRNTDAEKYSSTSVRRK